MTWKSNTYANDLFKPSTATFPRLQWHHAAGGILGEVAHWNEFKRKLPWPTERIAFKPGAKQTQHLCYLSEETVVALLARSTEWFDAAGNPTTGKAEGNHSRTRLLVLLKDAPDAGPVQITFTRKASQLILQALHRYSDLLTIASELAETRVPPCAFWLTIRAGEPTQVGPTGKQSTILPPVINLPNRKPETWFDENAVDEATLTLINGLAQQIAAWRDDRPPTPSGDAPDGAEEFVAEDDVYPFAVPPAVVGQPAMAAGAPETAAATVAPAVATATPPADPRQAGIADLKKLREALRQVSINPAPLTQQAVQEAPAELLAHWVKLHRDLVWRQALTYSAEYARVRPGEPPRVTLLDKPAELDVEALIDVMLAMRTELEQAKARRVEGSRAGRPITR